jgi:hypothetical protein
MIPYLRHLFRRAHIPVCPASQTGKGKAVQAISLVGNSAGIGGGQIPIGMTYTRLAGPIIQTFGETRR